MTNQDDKYPYLQDADVEQLATLIKNSYVNPFVQINDERERINQELGMLPQRRKQLDDLKLAIAGLQKGELITKDNNAMALGIGKHWKKIKVYKVI